MLIEETIIAGTQTANQTGIYELIPKAATTCDEKYTVNPDDFLSMGKSTPFEGSEVYGKCKSTCCRAFNWSIFGVICNA